jgi:hypothetical protein
MENTRVPRCLITILAGLTILAQAPTASAASISGTVRYEGDSVPKMKPIDMGKEEKCHASYSEAPLSEMIVIGGDKTFENVFVRVIGGLPEDKEYPVPEEPIIVDQLGCRYIPHVFGIQVDQKLKVLNSDGVLHNVNAKPKKMRPFNKAMPPAMTEFERAFNRAEFPFELKCDVHAWMGAYVGVMAHPFFSVTGKGGQYEISGLDAGTYEIEIWQEFWARKFGAMKFSVTLSDGEAKVVNIVYPYGKQAEVRPQ